MRTHALVNSRNLVFMLIFSTLLPLTQSCVSPAKVNLNTLSPLVEMSKGPCYGRCPVFTLTIYENGIATFKGEQHTERLGSFARKLDKTELERIKGEFRRANFSQFRDTYRGRIPDMQSVSISYYGNGKKKTVNGKEIRPNAVKWLEAQLDQIAHAGDWVRRQTPEEKGGDYIIPDELLIELSEETVPGDWAKKYSQVNMTLQRAFGDSNYWIFSYNDKVITPEQMLERVRKDEAVISAEFNKKMFNTPVRKN